MKKLCLPGILIGYLMPLMGQAPVVLPLDHRPVTEQKRISTKSVSQPDTIDLPFIDDFYYYDKSSFPDPALWTDRYVYINNHFPDQPRSNGVATFDALDADGQVYQDRGDSFNADTLTSCPINLQPWMTGVYLSFYYQPQGFGDAPEENDQLILQFKATNQTWRNVWTVAGTKSHPFKSVLVPLEENDLYEGFQFRFVNTVSFGSDNFNEGKKGNVDLWHVDYVRLDKDRHENDTAVVDVAMIAPLRSLIKGYTSIPWNQFMKVYASRLEPQIGITYRNNDNIGYLVKRVFEVTDMYHSQTTPVGSAGSENILGGKIITYKEEALNPFVTPATDSALFELKAYLETDERDRKENDTVRFYQEFKNYFSRDDGTPESGYGYEGINAQGFSIACHYEMFVPDTLRAVAIYFNPVLNNITRKYVFRIAVWKDEDGRPGEQIYLSDEEYSPLTTGEYTIFPLSAPLYIAKNYWIGWTQVTSGFLNVGFDLSSNDHGNLMYNSAGSWLTDGNYGTLMIRPYAGKPLKLTTAAPVPTEKINAELTVYPNPATHYIYVELSQAIDDGYELEIFGVTGQLYYKKPLTDNYIELSSLKQGVYILRLSHRKTRQEWTQRVVIRR
ncbi:MAG: T9SS type A sorting domain-containing protein [Bacteroidales bacterium]|nr:T9SS type A sorting domain-containing protein [Bacteroidales bacterium]